MGLVLRQSLGMILAGVGVGIARGLGGRAFVGGQVPGVRPPRSLTFATMVSVLMVAALFASFLPARRASRVDPTITLRQG